jgi:2-polyprenyl-3-methyl-5-hydroxy-6-metoxy-1,4-benzoquinol methylase
MRHINAPPLDVETSVDGETFKRLQSRVEDTWSALGQQNAHWSVITDDRFRKEFLEDNLDMFFQMGISDIDRVEVALNRIGTSMSDISSALDFGCGVGRLSIPLSQRVKRVLGVDISPAHLSEARARIEKLGYSNIDLKKISYMNEIRGLECHDLVMSIIVLQHNPPPVMREILDALCSRVNPGGFLYVQAQTYRNGYSYHAAEDLADTSTEMEMHILPQHIFLETIQDAGLTVMEVMEDGAAGSLDYRSQVVLARKR